MELTLSSAEFWRKLFTKWSLCCTWGVGCHSSDVLTSGTDSWEADEKASELASSDLTWSCRVDITLGPTSCAAYEGALELTSSAPAGSCGFGIAYRIKKKMYITQKKIILPVRSFSLSLRNRANMQRRKFTSLDCSRSDDRLGPGWLTAIGSKEGWSSGDTGSTRAAPCLSPCTPGINWEPKLLWTLE